MTYQEAQSVLNQTFEEVKAMHPSRGHEYIRTHWSRYACILTELPTLPKDAHVLEIGASILSTVLKRRFQYKVSTVHHELEPEWTERLVPDGIDARSLEILRDSLPYEPKTFDLILFDEVMEHFPVSPDFFLKKVFLVLKPSGQLILSIPNFATFEHRIRLLFGKNPQDLMDDNYIYYAHHREPVMQECLDLVKACGGRTLEYKWTDFKKPTCLARTCWNILRYAKHFELHKIAHVLIPSMRNYVFIRAVPESPFPFEKRPSIPPLARSMEFARKPIAR